MPMFDQMSALTRLYYGGAGDSGMRRYRSLAAHWRHRTFGRRTSWYFWTLFASGLIGTLELAPHRYRFLEGLFFGMVGMAFEMFPDVVMPDYITRWERGAWGEQSTARALKPLRKQGWVIRHDLATRSGKGNCDHIVVGPAVYLLDSKLLKDEVWLDAKGLHVRRVDDSGDEYVIPDLTRRMGGAARSLERELEAGVGFPVAVYPVVVVWALFAAGSQWDGDVAYVDGDQIATWLESRPTDLRDLAKRRKVESWLRSLPRA